MKKEILSDLLTQVRQLEYQIKKLQNEENPVYQSKFYYVSQDADILQGKLVKRGKTYISGLTRCQYMKKTYLVHEKFLISAKKYDKLAQSKTISQVKPQGTTIDNNKL